VIKRMTLVRRKPGLSDAEFDQRWLVQHGEMLKSLKGVARYVQNRAPAGTQWAGEAIDGIAEIWFSDEAAMTAALSTPLWAEIVADARDFLEGMHGFTAGEHSVIP
jgi:uncharacterized protein (TIGR02118 family)